jgi:perosamine synthetase
VGFINQVEPWLGKEEKDAMAHYLDSGGWLTEFKQTEHMESMISEFLGIKHAVLLNNGTISLTVALMALGIGRGDEVIVPDFTMIATANAVKLAGAEPVFVDIDEDTLCIDINKLEVSEKTKALIYVALNGRTGDIEEIRRFCKLKNIYLIEDACQGFGSKHNDRFIGTLGTIGCFSFSPHKIITTGQGGAIVTDDTSLFERVKQLKDFGRLKGGQDFHETLGFNFKFTDIQAVIGIAQLSKIDDFIIRKKNLFRLYESYLKNTPNVKMIKTDLEQTVPWFIDILVPEKEKVPLMTHLKDNGIGTRPFYPPVHLQPTYSHIKKHFPISEQISKKGLWLPSSTFLGENVVQHVCETIQGYLSSTTTMGQQDEHAREFKGIYQ